MTSTPTSPPPIDGDGDAEFARLIRGWMEDFHGAVKPMTEEKLQQRVKSYLRQEEQYREKVRFILSLLPGKPAQALDIGSSAGGLSVAMAQQGIDMEGIEPSEAGVEVSAMRARRLGVQNARFTAGVGEALPFKDDTFDLAVSVAVLEHVQDVDKVVSEAYRVLKPGAFFYAEVPNYLFPFEPHYKMAFLPMMPKQLAKRYVAARGGYPEFIDTLNYMNRPLAIRYFRRAGFTDVRDVQGEFLSGKAARKPWAARTGRLASMPWSAPAIARVLGNWPTALLLNRAVSILARKPKSSR